MHTAEKHEKIFESIKTGARRLSEFDLLRNNIFLRAGPDIDIMKGLYDTYWVHFEEDVFWTTEILDQFLRGFLTTKLGIEIDTDDLFNVYDRQYRSTLEADQGIEHELAELKQHAEVYQKVYVDISKEIATLTGLDFNERVLVRYDSTTLKRESVQILFNAGLCTDSDAEKLDDLLQNESPLNFPIENSIMDIFGEYYPNKKEFSRTPAKKEIVIYEQMCQLAATALNVDVEVLKEVIIVHEIAHAVTHLGKDNYGKIWEHFSNAETEDKELFAQIYPLLYFKEKSGKSEALKTFRRLAEHQDARYNAWRSYETKPLSEINEALHQVRSKQTSSGREQTNIRLDELFSPSVQYVIPSYQRSYTWSEENWSLLWDDIRKTSDLRSSEKSRNHFTGAIVLRSPEADPTNYPRYEIIDGHQRIATFQIIFAVIRDLCQKDYQDIAEEANHYLLNSFSIVAQENPNEKYKFLPHSADSEAFQAIVNGRPPKNKHHPMFQAYQYFKTQIAAYVNNDPDKIRNLLDSLLYDFALKKITLGPSDTSEKIFASIH